jgi:pimeloyl-ACP methyl ester carboxylesterase
MVKTTLSDEPNLPRRRFIGAAAMTIAAAELGVLGSGSALADETQTAQLPAIKKGANTSFGPLKQIDAGLLNVGYAEAGPSDGPEIILLHGWPYDIHSFVDVAPLLASAGYRVIVPYLRGYGTTRFLSSDTLRNGQQSAVAVDLIALMDALKIEKATLAGFDWGARTADIVAALWPERCKALVSVSGYLIGSQAAGKVPLPPAVELQWWYQYYFATERGRVGYDKYRRDFAKLIWRLASPKWDFDDATFDRSAPSFDNPTSPSSSTTTAGGSASLTARRNTTIWKRSLPPGRSSPCPRSRWKGTPMARPIPTPRLIATNSRANMRTSHQGRRRTQPAARGPASFRRNGHRRRPGLSQRPLTLPADERVRRRA